MIILLHWGILSCNPLLIWFQLSLHDAVIKKPQAATRCSMKKVVLRNFTKFTGKHLCQSLFFN